MAFMVSVARQTAFIRLIFEKKKMRSIVTFNWDGAVPEINIDIYVNVFLLGWCLRPPIRHHGAGVAVAFKTQFEIAISNRVGILKFWNLIPGDSLVIFSFFFTFLHREFAARGPGADSHFNREKKNPIKKIEKKNWKNKIKTNGQKKNSAHKLKNFDKLTWLKKR